MNRLHWNWHPKFGPVRILWTIWCVLWACAWFLVSAFYFWPALFTALPASVAALVLVFVERPPSQA